MKPIGLLLAMITLLSFASSCNKDGLTAVFSSIEGKWRIQADSTFIGVGTANRQEGYSGKPADYLNFSPDGHVYVFENSVTDTLSYASSADSILITGFNGSFPGKCYFQSPATHNLVISTGYLLTPGGILGRTLYLAR